MSKSNVIRVQTELPPEEYAKFKEVLKKEGLSIKEAAKRALEEWTVERIRFDSSDPLFDFSKTIKAGRTDASKIDKVVYSKEAVE